MAFRNFRNLILFYIFNILTFNFESLIIDRSDLEEICYNDTGLDIIGFTDGKIQHSGLVIHLGLLCFLTFDDLKNISDSIYSAMPISVFEETSYCNNPNEIIHDLDYDTLQSKIVNYDFYTENYDRLRSKALSCRLYNSKVGTSNYSGPDTIVAQNAVDLLLGFVNSNYQNLGFNDVILKYSDHAVLVNILYRKEFQTEDRMSERFIYDNLLNDFRSLAYSDVDYIIRDIDYYILKFNELLSQIGCNDKLGFHNLINELSSIYLALRIYKNKVTRNEHFNFRFNMFYSPRYEDYSRVMMWLAFRNSDLAYKTDFYNSQGSDFYLPISDDEDYNTYIKIIEKLFSKMVQQHDLFYRRYFNMIKALRSSLRYFENIESHIDRFVNSNLC